MGDVLFLMGEGYDPLVWRRSPSFRVMGKSVNGALL